MKSNLSRCHPGVFVQVGPGRVDDCYIVLFVACVYIYIPSQPPDPFFRAR